MNVCDLCQEFRRENPGIFRQCGLEDKIGNRFGYKKRVSKESWKRICFHQEESPFIEEIKWRIDPQRGKWKILEKNTWKMRRVIFICQPCNYPFSSDISEFTPGTVYHRFCSEKIVHDLKKHEEECDPNDVLHILL